MDRRSGGRLGARPLLSRRFGASAYELDDPQLIAKVKRWMDWTLNNQQPNGMLGPKGNFDWWPNYEMPKVMTQYQATSGDLRVIPAMQRYFAYQCLKSTPSR